MFVPSTRMQQTYIFCLELGFSGRSLVENKTSLFLSTVIVFNRLSAVCVVLLLDKGDFPENLHTVCPC